MEHRLLKRETPDDEMPAYFRCTECGERGRLSDLFQTPCEIPSDDEMPTSLNYTMNGAD